MASTPERGFSRLPEAFFLGVCGTRSALSAPPSVKKTGILIPVFSTPSHSDRSSSNILAVLMRGNFQERVRSHEDALEKRFSEAKPRMTFRPFTETLMEGGETAPSYSVSVG
jgi:hypothetical protein